MKRVLNVLVVLLLVVAAWSCTPTAPEGTMTVDTTEYFAGDEIKVQYEITKGDLGENAWIGIVPAEAAKGSVTTNDSLKIDSQTIKELKGELVFVAPETPGTYEFRLNVPTGDGFEVATVSFTVLEAVVEEDFSVYTLTVATPEVKVKTDITVTFTANAAWDAKAWIGIVPSETPHGDMAANKAANVGIQYLENKADGTLTFKAPEKKGSYDFRLHNSETEGIEVTSVTFTVK